MSRANPGTLFYECNIHNKVRGIRTEEVDLVLVELSFRVQKTKEEWYSFIIQEELAKELNKGLVQRKT